MRIIKVDYISEYKLKIQFSDRKIKIVDLEEMVEKSKGIFLPLKKLDYFKKVALDDCKLSICWPNGADICPDVLYNMGKDFKTQTKTIPTKKRAKHIYRKKRQTV